MKVKMPSSNRGTSINDQDQWDGKSVSKGDFIYLPYLFIYLEASSTEGLLIVLRNIYH